jgi:hypothetical protein
VAGIGEQRHRAGGETGPRLDQHECEIEDRADQESAAEIRRCVMMRVAMSMVVPVAMIVAVMMMVMERHGALLSSVGGAGERLSHALVRRVG